MTALAQGRRSSSARPRWRTTLVICGAIAALPLHPTSAPAQEGEYPAMEPPPDYVELQHERERNACINSGSCDQPVAPGRPANPDMWTALAISGTTKRYATLIRYAPGYPEACIPTT